MKGRRYKTGSRLSLLNSDSASTIVNRRANVLVLVAHSNTCGAIFKKPRHIIAASNSVAPSDFRGALRGGTCITDKEDEGGGSQITGREVFNDRARICSQNARSFQRETLPSMPARRDTSPTELFNA